MLDREKQRLTRRHSPASSMLDNLARRRDRHRTIIDPTLNPLFRDVLTHYGVESHAMNGCAISDRKGKVESGVDWHAQKYPI